MIITNCPKCGSTNFVKMGFTPQGKQCYKCKDCGYKGTFLGYEVGRPKSKNNQTCPQCGSVHIIKNGKRPQGYQVYKCKSCGYRGTFLGYEVGRPKTDC